MRTLPLLSGLAVLGVVLNHVNWHVLGTYTPGAAGGYPFLIIDQYGKMAIAAFLFIAGYFAAYATNGGKRDLPWEIVRSRVAGLLWPWLIWSALMTLGQSLQGRPISAGELLKNLFVQYYFLPMLLTAYLASPLLSHWARVHTKKLLIGAALVQVLAIGVYYLRVFWPGFPPVLHPWVDIGPLLYLRLGLSFPLGLAVGMFPKTLKEKTARIKTHLPWLALVFFGLSAVEGAFAYHLGGSFWPRGNDHAKLTTSLYALCLMLSFVALDQIRLPFKKFLTTLGTRSYGMYLAHYVVLGVLGKGIERFLPSVASSPWLYLPLVYVLTLGLTLLMMEIVARLPIQWIHRYVFG